MKTRMKNGAESFQRLHFISDRPFSYSILQKTILHGFYLSTPVWMELNPACILSQKIDLRIAANFWGFFLICPAGSISFGFAAVLIRWSESNYGGCLFTIIIIRVLRLSGVCPVCICILCQDSGMAYNNNALHYTPHGTLVG